MRRRYDLDAIRRAARRGGPDTGEEPFSGLSWWWMAVPSGIALAIMAAIVADSLLVGAAVVFAIVVVALVVTGLDDWF